MNQLLATTNRKVSFHKSKQNSFSKTQRKAETRTKIQLGGLLIKSGLADWFSIQVGSDLQLDEEEKEKATLLLGALIDMSKNLSLQDSKKEEWRILGRSAFMEHFLAAKEKSMR